ncbi:MAG: hypothetical protein Q7R53_00505, partial [bacterium]|nr:hypothetical protein [bacterium]
MSVLSERFSRRMLLKGALGLPLIPLFSGCDSVAKQKPFLTPTKERENILPKEGDVIATANTFYLLRNGKRYAFDPSGFAEYRRLTKFDKYKRKIFTNSSSVLDNYPLGTVPKEKYIIDWFTGDFKENSPLGGELNVYFAGFLSDGGIPLEPFVPRQDSFLSLRKRLEKDKWNEASSLFFTYGKDRLEQYSPEDTAVDPKKTIKQSLKFIKILKEQYPLVQFNFFGKSLGGIPALAAAREFPDVVNNLLLFSSPIRGIKDDFIRDNQIGVLNEALLKLGIIQEVTFYLRQLWKDKA